MPKTNKINFPFVMTVKVGPEHRKAMKAIRKRGDKISPLVRAMLLREAKKTQ